MQPQCDLKDHPLGHGCAENRVEILIPAHAYAICVWVPGALRSHSMHMYRASAPLQSDPRSKNLGSGCKNLELCADVVSDVGIKAKSRHWRTLQPGSYIWGGTVAPISALLVCSFVPYWCPVARSVAQPDMRSLQTKFVCKCRQSKSVNADKLLQTNFVKTSPPKKNADKLCLICRRSRRPIGGILGL